MFALQEGLLATRSIAPVKTVKITIRIRRSYRSEINTSKRDNKLKQKKVYHKKLTTGINNDEEQKMSAGVKYD